MRTDWVPRPLMRCARAAFLLLLASEVASAAARAGPLAKLLERVDRGDLSGAVRHYQTLYETRSSAGLAALREIALHVLRTELGRTEIHERSEVAAVLASQGETEALEVLEESLTSTDQLVRQSAAESLGRVGTPAAVAALRRLYERGADGRRLALSALGRAPERSALDLFLRALRSSDPSLRVVALRGLGRLRAPEARDPLRVAWRRESRPLVAGYIAFCLAALGDGAALQELKSRLTDPNASTRDQAAALLGFVEDPSVAPLLREALYDPSVFVRSSASASLTRLGDRSGLSVASRLLQDAELSVRLAAAGSLSRMDYVVARPVVLEALRSADPNVRAQALDAVGKGGDGRAAELVWELVRRERDPFVRSEGLLVLGEIGREPAVDHLLHTLPDSRAHIRHATAESLVTLTERLLADAE